MIFTPRQASATLQNHSSLSTTTTIAVPITIDNDQNLTDSQNDLDEDVLPRHVQIELTRNRKRIIELEDQIKELKRLSIRKIICMQKFIK